MPWIALGAGLLSLIYSVGIARVVIKQDPGSEEMRKISDYVHEGAMAFLHREYRTIAYFMVAVIVLLLVGLWAQEGITYAVGTALSYLVGAIFSLSAGYFGMQISTRANTRTTAAAKSEGFTKALQVAFYGGSVMGMSVVGLGLIGLALLYLIFYSLTKDAKFAASILAGFSMGASSVALFARVGGGIYTKAADVGADLTGKVEAGIPEDDPRNPGTIADNVGDNVGDCAGMGADLYESYVGSILSGIVIAAAIGRPDLIALAFLLASIGIVTSLIGILFIRGAKDNPQRALFRTTLGAALFFAFLSFFAVWKITGSFKLYWAVLSGLVAGMIIGYVALYYSTGKRIQAIAKSSESGVAINILEGIATGMMSSVIPLIAIAAAIVVAFWAGGFYGIALAGIGMLSITGITVAVDAYGPIADNAGGIAEMAHLPPEIRKITDSLDAAGNTPAAIGKGFAIGAAALTALALFSAFTKQANLTTLDILNARVIAGIFVGAAMPFFFSASVIRAVGRTANKVVQEVRRQFREIKGLLEGTAKADYARCVDITTKGALKEMILPGVVAFLTPIIIGAVFGLDALGGFLAGSLAVGVPLAIFMANAGAAWDNAKKWIEEGNLGGKGSDAHKASVEGDTVGDPFKDTAGPSLNILLKLMAIVSLVFIPLISLLNNAVKALF
jgi:K(+)-stimulated pyrophosphate-energized sodium pump